MSTDPLPNGQSQMIVLPHDLDWGDDQDAGNRDSSGGGLTSVLHAFRRRWLLATALGICGGLMASFTAWRLTAPTYSTASLLRVASQDAPLVFKTVDQASVSSFDIYKRTQRELLKSDFVLAAALRKKDVMESRVIQSQIDPAEWLKANLGVGFPGEAEIMQVSLASQEPKGLNTVVNAVVNAYLEEIVQKERDLKRERLNKLESIYEDANEQVRQKRNELKRLVEIHGSGSSDALSLKQQNTLQQYAIVRNELTKLHFESMRARGELETLKKQVIGPALPDAVPNAEIDAYIAADASVMVLENKVANLNAMIAKINEEIKSGSKEYHIERLQAQLNTAEESLKSHRAELRSELLEHWNARPESVSNDGSDELRAKIAILAAQEKQLQQEVNELENEAKQFGKSSIDVEMMRSEMSALEQVLSSIGEEIERSKVELRDQIDSTGGSRVTLFSSAYAPRRGKSMTRYSMAGLAGVVGMAFPLFGIIFWDTRKKCINSPEEISGQMSLEVIGSLPLISQRKMRRVNHQNQRTHWMGRLTEAVDSVAAVFIRKARLEQHSVIMITSALAGEGKTTLASQLAVSLAASGQRTVLVDCDLRRSVLHQLFEANLQPGLSEWLSGRADVISVIQPTGIENLSLVAAGRRNESTLGQLAGDEIENVFQTLRAGFDFIVVDGSPVLPVVDARLIGQHVDSVVLSVLRDVSCAPRISAACEILRSFKIPLMGAVVLGSRAEAYYSDTNPLDTDDHFADETSATIPEST
ncbi:Tyrosine-protein kinase CpsD [Symmachiella macrocystis]|uniref:non-specific protein-tyrosine kinase n=1 Tax=Symmachiella macrocystis TaxID=2527985 RepID=A0A5C6B3S0_9PLAN|nr:polysaccharide biosynthesis tyrosine autokinase [Symmachiella macrocystis]TWU06955.1 Tyrosine-protein kinase CpsD [Symmachiella macrocystis]